MNEYTFVAVVVYVLISHNPKKFQHSASMACLNEIVDKSLRYIFVEYGSFRENNK